MRSLMPAAALVAILLGALPSVSRAADRDQEQPFGGPPPQRQIEERPFGGPPPRGRSIKREGVVCRTAKRVCRLEQPMPLGAACSCPAGSGGEAAAGKVE
ncbi:MAG TPA: hypothetical protein VKF35_22250 [Hyphomicrobiaceae bacterium]|nr:hypothetical protein [Hyphomicrobiaceae bacterium]